VEIIRKDGQETDDNMVPAHCTLEK